MVRKSIAMFVTEICELSTLIAQQFEWLVIRRSSVVFLSWFATVVVTVALVLE